MINVEGLYKSFGEQPVLIDINLVIPDGQILGILGESGSGKSVLLRNLIGIEKPERGTIRINGRDIVPLPERELLPIRRDIGYLFQDGALYDFMTVFENVAFPLAEHARLGRRAVRDKVVSILQMVGLGEALAKYPSELSGGMRKRAALARAVILDSRILFCDEPTSGLDPIKSREISDLIREVSRQLRCTTVLTSHDVGNTFRIADQVVVLRQGRIIAQATPGEMRMVTDPFIQDFLNRD